MSKRLSLFIFSVLVLFGFVFVQPSQSQDGTDLKTFLLSDIVQVKDGYARNFLFPKDLAAAATSFNIKSLEHQKKAIA